MGNGLEAPQGTEAGTRVLGFMVGRGLGTGNWLPLGPAGESMRRHAPDARAFAHDARPWACRRLPQERRWGLGRNQGSGTREEADDTPPGGDPGQDCDL